MAKKRRSNRPKPKRPKPAGGTVAPLDASDEAADVVPASEPDAKRRAKGGSKAGATAGSRAGADVPAKAGSKRARSSSGATNEADAWFGIDVSWTKLAVTRVVLFALLSLDALLSIRHAPRYGASDFNVAHVGFLDELGPGRVGYGVGQLICAYLFALVACGVGTRVVLPIATVVYAWLYFGSQLDSYQHHYLVVLVLAIGCFVPWQRPANPATPVRSWAVRLVLVQLAIMYLWAAISKLDPQWLDGSALSGQLSGFVRSIGDKVGFGTIAVLVVIVEFGLAAIVWWRRAWIVAAPLGLAFHLGIVLTGLEIGLFAYLMLAIYALVVPDAVWQALARPFAGAGAKVRELGERKGAVAIGIGIAVGTAAAAVVRFPHALPVAAAMASVPFAIAMLAVVRGGPAVAAPGIAHVVAIVAWIAVDRGTSVAEDYYRYWGGSQRRLGDVVTAEAAYRKLVELAPDKEVGHFQLGRILLARGWTDEGLDELHAAQRADPRLARAFLEEVRWLVNNNRMPEALAKAKDAVAAEPGNAEAKALLDSLTAARPVPPPKVEME